MLLIGQISGCLNKKSEKIRKNTFFKIISKIVYISFMCLYFLIYHSCLSIYFCKAYLENELHLKKIS
jgi:hypothetical protein